MKTKAKKISVTARDIERGDPLNSLQCPIALACKRTFKRKAEVDGFTAEVKMKNKTKVFELPEKAQNFVDDFDAGRTVKPFSFTLKEVKSNDSY